MHHSRPLAPHHNSAPDGYNARGQSGSSSSLPVYAQHSRPPVPARNHANHHHHTRPRPSHTPHSHSLSSPTAYKGSSHPSPSHPVTPLAPTTPPRPRPFQTHVSPLRVQKSQPDMRQQQYYTQPKSLSSSPPSYAAGRDDGRDGRAVRMGAVRGVSPSPFTRTRPTLTSGHSAPAAASSLSSTAPASDAGGVLERMRAAGWMGVGEGGERSSSEEGERGAKNDSIDSGYGREPEPGDGALGYLGSWAKLKQAVGWEADPGEPRLPNTDS